MDVAGKPGRDPGDPGTAGLPEGETAAAGVRGLSPSLGPTKGSG